MAELFIAVLGASNLTFADATWTQSRGRGTQARRHHACRLEE
jgi:hypothetical protein